MAGSKNNPENRSKKTAATGPVDTTRHIVGVPLVISEVTHLCRPNGEPADKAPVRRFVLPAGVPVICDTCGGGWLRSRR